MAKRQSATEAAKREVGAQSTGATISQTKAALEEIKANQQSRLSELAAGDAKMLELAGMEKALRFVIDGPQEVPPDGVDEAETKE